MDIASNINNTVFMYSFDWKERKNTQVIEWILGYFPTNKMPIIKELPNNGDETEIVIYSSNNDLDSFLSDFYDEGLHIINQTAHFFNVC